MKFQGELSRSPLPIHVFLEFASRKEEWIKINYIALDSKKKTREKLIFIPTHSN